MNCATENTQTSSATGSTPPPSSACMPTSIKTSPRPSAAAASQSAAKIKNKLRGQEMPVEQKGQKDMLVFDELWNGAFSPCEHRYERNSDYDTVSRRINAQMDVLRQNASKRQKKVWEAYDRDLAERENLEQQDAYYQGIRFGARFMLDVLLEQPGSYEAQR